MRMDTQPSRNEAVILVGIVTHSDWNLVGVANLNKTWAAQRSLRVFSVANSDPQASSIPNVEGIW